MVVKFFELLYYDYKRLTKVFSKWDECQNTIILDI